MFNYLYKVLLIILIFNLYAIESKAKKYTLLVEPIYPEYQIQEVYKPLKSWLTEFTGFEIEIKSDLTYYFYWQNAKGDNYPDFTFDASHIGLYRSINKNYIPLFTTIEPLTYHLVSLNDIDKNYSISEYFNGKSISMISRPSIAAELFQVWFDNKFITPYKNVISVSWHDTLELLFDGKVDAAIIPSNLKELYPNLVTHLKSKKIQGSTIMASPQVPKGDVEKFKLAILMMNNNSKAFNVLNELNTQGFMPVNEDEFQQIQYDFPYIFK